MEFSKSQLNPFPYTSLPRHKLIPPKITKHEFKHHNKSIIITNVQFPYNILINKILAIRDNKKIK